MLVKIAVICCFAKVSRPDRLAMKNCPQKDALVQDYKLSLIGMGMNSLIPFFVSVEANCGWRYIEASL